MTHRCSQADPSRLQIPRCNDCGWRCAAACQQVVCRYAGSCCYSDNCPCSLLKAELQLLSSKKVLFWTNREKKRLCLIKRCISDTDEQKWRSTNMDFNQTRVNQDRRRETPGTRTPAPVNRKIFSVSHLSESLHLPPRGSHSGSLKWKEGLTSAGTEGQNAPSGQMKWWRRTLDVHSNFLLKAPLKAITLIWF